MDALIVSNILLFLCCSFVSFVVWLLTIIFPNVTHLSGMIFGLNLSKFSRSVTAIHTRWPKFNEFVQISVEGGTR